MAYKKKCIKAARSNQTELTNNPITAIQNFLKKIRTLKKKKQIFYLMRVN